MRFFPLLLLFLLFACGSEPVSTENPVPATTNESFTDLLEEYYEMRLELYPLEATFIGDNRYNDQLPNSLTKEYKNQVAAFFQGSLDELNAFDRSSLNPTERVSYDVLKWECDINLEGLEFSTELLPLDQFNGFHLMIGQLASGQSAQPFVTIEDYDNWLARLESFNAMLDTAVVNMDRGIQAGYVLPQSLTDKLLPQLEAMTREPLEDHLYYGPVLAMSDEISPVDQNRIKADYGTMVTRLIDRFRRVAAYVNDEYRPASRTSSGISEIPDGAAYYNHLIKLYTTTNMTADEIHQLGLKEVARLTSEMEQVKAQVGFTGDLKQFFDEVRVKPELRPFTKPEEVIANFNAIHEKMKPQLAKLFDQTPKTSFEVRRTEAFREASASAEYNPGSQDGTRPGIFYVPIPDVETYNIFSDEDLFLHEAIPGHHYQVSLTQENEDLPDFRRSLWYSAYGEGWALYCESLGEELGLYDDPYQYFGMLSAEMHRAIRLVVDTGIHSKGWSREKAIQYSLDHEAESEASITAEIERYMAIPGQALSYKIGQLKISELRAKAETQMGDEFDIKEFHNLVLSPGCVPLAVLETMVVEWMEK
ncbi:DUF885 domain-containing protein [Neolewinella persica]|uniref:DUF885 domain-containing protein n=1 Tax=Neolewinella persica TaxID=70998 RepID=UPI0003A75F45|nr:DUF885 domain-containing protein [Neolewinella persica]